MFAACAASAALWPQSSATPIVAAAVTKHGRSIGAGKRTQILVDKDYERRDVMHRLIDEVHDHTQRISKATHGSDELPIRRRETIERSAKKWL